MFSKLSANNRYHAISCRDRSQHFLDVDIIRSPETSCNVKKRIAMAKNDVVKDCSIKLYCNVARMDMASSSGHTGGLCWGAVQVEGVPSCRTREVPMRCMPTDRLFFGHFVTDTFDSSAPFERFPKHTFVLCVTFGHHQVKAVPGSEQGR